MNADVSIMVYQSLDEIQYDSFTHPTVMWLSENRITHFVVDSFSDSIQFDYASRFLEESANPILVCLLDQGTNTKGLPKLLMESSRQGVKILQVGVNTLTEKVNSTVLENHEQMEEELAYLISNLE